MNKINGSAEFVIEELTKIRKDLGLRQVDIADAMNVSQPVISELESGKTSPRYETLRKYANAVGYRMEMVPDGEEEAQH